VSTDPLGVDTETVRRLGYRTVDLLVDCLALNGLVRDYPAIGEEIRAAAAGRVRWH
jgi:hypothetical protein